MSAAHFSPCHRSVRGQRWANKVVEGAVDGFLLLPELFCVEVVVVTASPD